MNTNFYSGDRAIKFSPTPPLASTPVCVVGAGHAGCEAAAAAARAVKEWGTGASGSRLVTGSTELHAELERELAEFCGAAAALVFFAVLIVQQW